MFCSLLYFLSDPSVPRREFEHFQSYPKNEEYGRNHYNQYYQYGRYYPNNYFMADDSNGYQGGQGGIVY